MNVNPRNVSTKAPVIILSGFLGSGKTTLLNRILTADHGRRIAVIVNEFGEVGIDHHLLLTSDHEVVQMNNGCVCCTVRGDLLRSFFDLMEHRSQFDTVVIETTGLAEPAPVAQTLYADERIRNNFTLGGVVTVVDAKYISARLEDSAEACEQIAFADLILLNKTDLIPSEQLIRSNKTSSISTRLPASTDKTPRSTLPRFSSWKARTVPRRLTACSAIMVMITTKITRTAMNTTIIATTTCKA